MVCQMVWFEFDFNELNWYNGVKVVYCLEVCQFVFDEILFQIYWVYFGNDGIGKFEMIVLYLLVGIVGQYFGDVLDILIWDIIVGFDD